MTNSPLYIRSYFNLPNLAQPLKHLDTYRSLETQLTELIVYNGQLRGTAMATYLT